MPLRRHVAIAAAGALLLLQACSTAAPNTAPGAGAESVDEPELTLNLPDPDAMPAPLPEGADYTLLDRGYSALAGGDHLEAVTQFKRYQRLEKSAVADWEAGIAIAYVSSLPRSPYYDPMAARSAYLRLQRAVPQGVKLHEKTLILRDALGTLVSLDAQVRELEKSNVALSETLEKREEALRRLRELTLGQKGAAQ